MTQEDHPKLRVPEELQYWQLRTVDVTQLVGCLSSVYTKSWLGFPALIMVGHTWNSRSDHGGHTWNSSSDPGRHTSDSSTDHGGAHLRFQH